MGAVMNKLLLYNYSLAVYFSREKKELVNKGTWFLFSSEFFCFTVSFFMTVLSMLPFKIPGIGLLIILGLIWYFTFYATKNWLILEIEEMKIEHQLKNVESIILYRLIGLSLYFGAFFLFSLVGVLAFDGYLIR